MQLAELFEHCWGLEFFLQRARIELERPLHGGGGHPTKMALILEGGVGVVAKAGTTPEELTRAKREVAAWVLAQELELPGLVPATVLRQVPDSLGSPTSVLGSAQILWPRFETALKKGIDHDHCPETVAWPIALFDTLSANTDRHLDNWGTIDELPHVVLIDHGHAFAEDASNSGFSWRFKDQPLESMFLSKVRKFVEHREESRLSAYLEADELNRVFSRAELIAQDGVLRV